MACAHATQTEDQAVEAPKAKATTHATSKTTKEMFKTEGLKQLQSKLDVKETGRLDSLTQHALRNYQKKEGLAQTGLPDYEVIRRLGIKPDDLYHHKPPAERVGVP